jgi:hypothetical protein
MVDLACDSAVADALRAAVALRRLAGTPRSACAAPVDRDRPRPRLRALDLPPPRRPCAGSRRARRAPPATADALMIRRSSCEPSIPIVPLSPVPSAPALIARVGDPGWRLDGIARARGAAGMRRSRPARCRCLRTPPDSRPEMQIRARAD